MKSSEHFLSPAQKCQILAVLEACGQELEKVSIFTAKGTSIRESTLLKPFCVKTGSEVRLPGRLGKNKVTKDRIFHIFTQKPPLIRSSPNLVWGRLPGRNQRVKVHSNPFRGFDFVGGRNLAFPIGTKCRR